MQPATAIGQMLQLLNTLLPGPEGTANPPRLTCSQKSVLFSLVVCKTQAEAARKCFMSKRKYEAELVKLRRMFNCATNLQLIVKIIADFHMDNAKAAA